MAVEPRGYLLRRDGVAMSDVRVCPCLAIRNDCVPSDYGRLMSSAGCGIWPTGDNYSEGRIILRTSADEQTRLHWLFCSKDYIVT